jgi:hypothetical protein
MTISRKKRRPVPAVIDANQRFEIDEGSAILRQSRAKTYSDIKNGTLRVIKDGARTYIPGTELIRRSTLPAAVNVDVAHGRA